MTMLTDSERKLLSDLREAEARATPGEWRVAHCEDIFVYHSGSMMAQVCHVGEEDEDGAGDDARLIALARNNLTPLLDLVERLDRELGEQAARLRVEDGR